MNKDCFNFSCPAHEAQCPCVACPNRTLSEFTKPCPKGHNCATCSWYFPGIQDYGRCEPPCCGFWESDDSMIARPPQSWCYVEELT